MTITWFSQTWWCGYILGAAVAIIIFAFVMDITRDKQKRRIK